MTTPKKGTKANPYTLEEYEALADEGLWQGGFVKIGENDPVYIMREVDVIGYSGCSGYGSSGSGSDDIWGSDNEGSDNPWNQGGSHGGDETGGGGGNSGGINTGTSGNGNTSGGGNPSGGNANDLITETEAASLIRMASIPSSKLANFLKELQQNGRIVRTTPTSKHKFGYYNRDEKKIYITKNTRFYHIWHELVHLLQDELGLLGNDKNGISRSSNNEFQAYIIQNIIDMMLGNLRGQSFASTGLSSNIADDLYVQIITPLSTDNSGIYWIEQSIIDFLNNGDKETWVNGFIHYWESIPHPDEYTRPYNPNYDWQWEVFFDFFGIEIR